MENTHWSTRLAVKKAKEIHKLEHRLAHLEVDLVDLVRLIPNEDMEEYVKATTFGSLHCGRCREKGAHSFARSFGHVP